MVCLVRARPRHAVFGLAVFLALLATPVVAGEIFKCVAKDGGPLYQNFPCYIDSIGSLPSDPPTAKTPSMTGVAGQEKPKTQPVSQPVTQPINMASISKSSHAGELSIGMTSDEVRALLGEPEEMVADEPESGGPISTWRYADGRTVRFDRKHLVLAEQR